MAASSCCTVFDPSAARLAGSHRVQRVPANEKRGRRHSSEVTVVALNGAVFKSSGPVLDPLSIPESDLRWDFFKSPGAGGQRKNKVVSAARLSHLPTGIVVTATEQRHQRQNKQVALERLAAELAARETEKRHEAANAARAEVFDEFRNFTWTDWRDEVKGPGGKRTSMKRALAGKLGPLIG